MVTMADVCRGCEERHTACHDHCEKYIEARAEYDRQIGKIKKEKTKEAQLNIAIWDGVQRRKKRKLSKQDLLLWKKF